MLTVHLGRKDEAPIQLQQSDDLLAVRTRSKRSLRDPSGPVAVPIPTELRDGTLVAAYPEAGVEVFRVPVGKGERKVADRKLSLRAKPDVRFAGGVLADPDSGEPVVYTENLFVKFVDQLDPAACRQVLRDEALTVKKELSYATNAFFVQAPEGTGQAVFEIARKLLDRKDVEYSHPELVRPKARKGIFPQQWHLKKTVIGGKPIDAHANVEAAHLVTRGEGITIAIIDDGVDIGHPEFARPGKIVAPRDVTEQSDDPNPKDPEDGHGTACAGVATADGAVGASGVAPAAHLMPIRFASGLGSQAEAEAFVWAADHGADVISCSWGPTDGPWWDLQHPKHKQKVQMPGGTRVAIEYALKEGRQGKGCVILFAAGNGNETVDNDGYASFPGVIAVAACNDTGRRSVYSDFGKAVWCAFPSNDIGDADLNQPAPLTPGIWTVDRQGHDGYNAGEPSQGDAEGLFTNSFGGTSSACPGAAGIVALMLSVNPSLKWHEVKTLLHRACDKIDPQGGQYDSAGRSDKYGAGRLNARSAVDLAKPAARNQISLNRRYDLPLPDLRTVSVLATVPEATPVHALSVEIDIRHSYIGDLEVALEPPPSLGLAPIVLHNRSGGSKNNIRRIYDAVAVSALAGLQGRPCNGDWSLKVRDHAARDTGVLVSWGLILDLPQTTVGAPTVATDKNVTPAGASAPSARGTTGRAPRKAGHLAPN